MVGLPKVGNVLKTSSFLIFYWKNQKIPYLPLNNIDFHGPLRPWGLVGSKGGTLSREFIARGFFRSWRVKGRGLTFFNGGFWVVRFPICPFTEL